MINGALDRQVLPAENLAGIHADIEETMAPAALEAVSGWIAARFGSGR